MKYEPSWDLPHDPKQDVTWQESDCYWFFDSKAGVGGWHRIGQYPNKGIGQSSLFLYSIGGKRFLDRSIEVPATQCSQMKNGRMVGRSSVECVEPQVMRYQYNHDESNVNLLLTFEESFYGPRDWFETGDVPSAWNKGHLEVAGRLRGEVEIDGSRYKLDALAHRDRSWGPRSLQGTDVFWFCNGTTGPELSWASTKARLPTGEFIDIGFVIRDGQAEDVKGIDINVLTAFDGLTILRAFMTLKTESWALDLDIRTNQGFMNRPFPEPLMVLDQSAVVIAEGRTGFADFASLQNVLRGDHLPQGSEVRLTCVEDGLSDYQNHSDAFAPGVLGLIKEGT